MIGSISQQDAVGIKAGTQSLNLQPGAKPSNESIIGIPFEMIRSTQVQRTSAESQSVHVELTDP
ncbi:Hypothetical protein AA314_06908 [Archangium gephyra]|uniref:Uncharacterized protein n=1 Tax=Archangium gephyra TaxID=48 RepID=A0AAC8TGL6_9BACT|nr:Hypothetical protein AA314_06908 [Archangium gephyra]